MLSTFVILGLCSGGLREDPEGEYEMNDKGSQSIAYPRYRLGASDSQVNILLALTMYFLSGVLDFDDYDAEVMPIQQNDVTTVECTITTYLAAQLSGAVLNPDFVP